MAITMMNMSDPYNEKKILWDKSFYLQEIKDGRLTLRWNLQFIVSRSKIYGESTIVDRFPDYFEH